MQVLDHRWNLWGDEDVDLVTQVNINNQPIGSIQAFRAPLSADRTIVLPNAYGEEFDIRVTRLSIHYSASLPGFPDNIYELILPDNGKKLFIGQVEHAATLSGPPQIIMSLDKPGQWADLHFDDSNNNWVVVADNVVAIPPPPEPPPPLTKAQLIEILRG